MSILEKVHTTKEGDSMLVCQMTDQHLLATVKLFAKRAGTALQALQTTSTDYFPGALSLSDKFNKEEIRERLKETVEQNINNLVPYVFEVARRGGNIQQELEFATGISGQVSMPDLSQSLALPFDDTEDYEF